MATATAAVRNAFVYGTLLAPEVLTVLLRRVPRSSPAVVHDYHRYSIKNRIYPAVLPKKGDKVVGKVLFDMSEQELYILDQFEDTDYTKLIVSPLALKAHDEVVDDERTGAEQVTLSNDENVTLGSNTVEVPPNPFLGLGLAYMYIWAEQGDPDLFGDWDYELWRANHLQTFLKTDSGFSGSRSDCSS